MVRWRIGKSALMAGTFSITFAGFAMRCPLAMPGSILESSCDGTSADAAPQFQFDEAVHFDRVLDGNPLRHHFSGPQDEDRKSTRLNSSHGYISYAVFCLKTKMLRHGSCSAMMCAATRPTSTLGSAFTCSAKERLRRASETL